MTPDEPKDVNEDAEYKGELFVEHADDSEDVAAPVQATPGVIVTPVPGSSDNIHYPPITEPTSVARTTAEDINPAKDNDYGYTPANQTPSPAQSPGVDANTQFPINEQRPAAFVSAPLAPSVVPTPIPLPAKKQKLLSKKLLIIALAILLVLGVSAGYIFAFYLPNTSKGVWDTGFERTGKEFSSFVEKISDPKALDALQKTALKIDGTVKTAEGEFSASLDSKIDDTKTDSSLKVGVTSEDLNANIQALMKTQLPENAIFPNIYFNITRLTDAGLGGVIGDVGQYEGKWIAVEQEQWALLEESMLGSEAQNSNLTQAEIASILRDVDSLAQEYVFTSNPEKAVIQQESFVGTEESEGIKANHYKAKIHKENLKQLCIASVDTLSANEVIKSLSSQNDDNYNKSVEESRKNCDTASDEIEVGDSFDLWIDKNYKLIHKIRLYENLSKKNVELQTRYEECTSNNEDFGASYCDYIDNQIETGERYTEIGQTYKGNDSFEFFANYVSNTNKSTASVTAKVLVNVKSYTLEGTIAGNTNDNGQGLNVNFTVKTEPYDGEIDAEKPSGTIGIDQVIETLMEGYSNIFDTYPSELDDLSELESL